MKTKKKKLIAQWKVSVHDLLRELLEGNPEANNGQLVGLRYGVMLASELMVNIANRAIELDDKVLLDICLRLGLLSENKKEVCSMCKEEVIILPTSKKSNICNKCWIKK